MTHGRFYGDLASWWPLVSPPEDYGEEAAFIASVLERGAGVVVRVLELGSGGGHNAFHLKSRFALTLVDLSEPMLASSRRLNPELEHVQGDMRSLRLDRTFDAVLIHDAIDYMTTEAELLAAMQTAFAHCRPGGAALFIPDDTVETYEPGAELGGTDDPDGRGIRLVEWGLPAQAGTSVVTVHYVFNLLHADRRLEVVHDAHEMGLFPHATWMRLVAEAGFAPEAISEVTTEARAPRSFFLGRRPA